VRRRSTSIDLLGASSVLGNAAFELIETDTEDALVRS
jgi:hypothetical protein